MLQSFAATQQMDAQSLALLGHGQGEGGSASGCGTHVRDAQRRWLKRHGTASVRGSRQDKACPCPWDLQKNLLDSANSTMHQHPRHSVIKVVVGWLAKATPEMGSTGLGWLFLSLHERLMNPGFSAPGAAGISWRNAYPRASRPKSKHSSRTGFTRSDSRAPTAGSPTRCVHRCAQNDANEKRCQ